MKQKKILVVDDEIEILRFIEKALLKYNYFVKVTNEPLEVENILKIINFDLILLDLKMPGMDGLKLLEIIKENYPKIEVIIMTANVTIETALECLRKGAIEYLIKPFEIAELLATIEKTLGVIELKSQLISFKELDKLKDEFISTVSHELRTPLTAISGAIEILYERENMEDEKRSGLRRQIDKDMHKLLSIIGRQTKKMKELVGNLLDFAKMEAGFTELKKDNIRIENIIKEVIEEVKPLADAKKIEITQDINSENINCDYEYMKQVITNLISNSIKYTQENGRVSIYVGKVGDEIRFIVEDSGFGIVNENLGKVFEKFYRVDQSLTRESGGFGLGLSICQKIIELHGGKIWAESDGLGKGSKFIFTLPI